MFNQSFAAFRLQMYRLAQELCNPNVCLLASHSSSSGNDFASPILAHWLSECLSHSLSARAIAPVCVRRCAVFAAVC